DRAPDHLRACLGGAVDGVHRLARAKHDLRPPAESTVRSFPEAGRREDGALSGGFRSMVQKARAGKPRPWRGVPWAIRPGASVSEQPGPEASRLSIFQAHVCYLTTRGRQ